MKINQILIGCFTNRKCLLYLILVKTSKMEKGKYLCIKYLPFVLVVLGKNEPYLF